jgi:asparagine synthase (glutamine-hydrolysing)
MGRTLARRGPDIAGELVGDAYGLGHRHRRTSSDAKPAQPFRRGGCAIVADARLDHRHDLLRALDLVAGGGRPPGDAELVLCAYQRWGEDCVGRLVGDFAFAIWDEARQQLFCARDHFGARPFLYATTPNLFAFGSEATAILEVPGVPRVLNEARIGDFLVEGYHEGFDATATFLRDIVRLPPAHSLTVARGRVTTRRFWSVLSACGGGALSPDDAVDGFREHLMAAVRERSADPESVGAMLSGGIDSSAIVAFAAAIRAERGEPPLWTFSCVDADGTPSRESDYIRLAARTPHVAATLIRPQDVAGLDGALDDLLDTVDDPFDIMEVNLLVYRAASRAGLTAVLDGCDGDLVASRNGAMRFAVQSGRWLIAWRAAGDYARWGHLPRWRPLVGRGLRPALRGVLARFPGVERFRRDLRRRQHRYETTVDTCYIRRSFAERIDLEARRQAALDHFFPAPLFRATPDEEYAHWLESGLIGAALERYDRLAASQSVEPRHPFLDVRLVSFTLGIPWDSPANQGLPKALLRRAAARHLTPAICQRAFDPPVHGAIRQTLVGLKRRRLEETIRGTELVDEFVDREALFAGGTGRDPDDRQQRALTRVALLAAWLGRARPER